MGRIIDTDDLEKTLDELTADENARVYTLRIFNEGLNNGLVKAVFAAEKVPEAAVYCKDCKWWGVYDEPIKHCRRGMLKLPVRGEEFCSRGERKPDKK